MPENGSKEMEVGKEIIAHIRHMYGWHGGMGDPPNDNTIKAIIRGTIEFIDIKLEEEDDGNDT